MRFGTLENTSKEDILHAFNCAFSDYVVPLQLTVQQLHDKILGDQVDLQLSPAAFEDDRLVAFILHGFDQSRPSIVYNAGTGVIPSNRGCGLTSQLYRYILPTLSAKGINTVQLEVITENKSAFSVYQKLGFTIERTLHCFKGTMNIESSNHVFSIVKPDQYDWPTMTGFWETNPSWQNSITAVEALKEKTVSIAALSENNMVGYLIYNPNTGRVLQFAVKKVWWNKGVGEAIFGYVCLNYSNHLSMINVDSNSEFTINFLEGAGLRKYISQFEMQWVFQ